MTRKVFDEVTGTNISDEGWVNLSGCNTCINSEMCKNHGSCILLTINQIMPEYTKRKRSLISKLRQTAFADKKGIDYFLELARKHKRRYDKQIEEGVRKEVPINLTSFEKMCIKSLNKNRNN